MLETKAGAVELCYAVQLPIDHVQSNSLCDNLQHCHSFSTFLLLYENLNLNTQWSPNEQMISVKN